MSNGIYPLYQLISHQGINKEKDYLSMVKYMINNGADYNKVGFNNYSLIHASTDINITKYLIELGMDIHAVSKNNATTLIGSVASKGKGTEITSYLIERCVDLNTKAKFNDVEIDAYEMAIKLDRTASAELIKIAMENPPKQCLESNKIPPIMEFDNLINICNRKSTTISIKIKAQGSGIGDTHLFINDTEYINKDNNDSTNIINFSAKLQNGINELKVYAFNKDNEVKSETITATIHCELDDGPVLHAVIIGINDDSTLGVADSMLFGTTLYKRARGIFSRVDMIYLNKEEDTTKMAILEKLKNLSSISENDTFVFYSASLGKVVDDKYYLLTSEVESIEGEDLENNALSELELKNVIANIPARNKLLLFDTDNSSTVNETIIESLMKDKNEQLNMASISAININNIGLSEIQNNHGLFATLLSDGLDGDADLDKDSIVNSIELIDYMSKIDSKNYYDNKSLPFYYHFGDAFKLAKVKYIEEKQTEALDIGRFKFTVKDNSILITIDDKVEKHFKFINDKGENIIVLDFNSKQYTKPFIKNINTLKVVNIKVGYHKEFYRIAIQLRDDQAYELIENNGSVEIVLKD